MVQLFFYIFGHNIFLLVDALASHGDCTGSNAVIGVIFFDVDAVVLVWALRGSICLFGAGHACPLPLRAHEYNSANAEEEEEEAEKSLTCELRELTKGITGRMKQMCGWLDLD